MDSHILRRRLHHVAALACGVLASLCTYVACTALGIDLSRIVFSGDATSRNRIIASVVWWATATAGFVFAWAAQMYLVAAAREREFIYRLAQQCLIVLVFVVTAAAGILSKNGNISGATGVISGLAALSLGFLCAYCGSRLAYLNAEQG